MNSIRGKLYDSGQFQIVNPVLSVPSAIGTAKLSKALEMKRRQDKHYRKILGPLRQKSGH